MTQNSSLGDNKTVARINRDEINRGCFSVWDRTLHLDKPIAPLFEAQYDIRIIVACLKKMLGTDTIKKDNLPPINPLKLPKIIDELLKAVMSCVPISKKWGSFALIMTVNPKTPIYYNSIINVRSRRKYGL